MHWAYALSYARDRALEKQREERQELCIHRHVKLSGTYPANSRIEHTDGNGYTVRYLGRIKHGVCIDCDGYVEESSIGSEVFILAPIV
ncbi:hypothetical protein BK004_04595 [bacterium CG10_46_32]|nr:MAG: hypothetical protein BK004_04595 [bacterium CG10_46_32]PIR55721.1 MAG: hypothetical protein COU73_04635 [Parcubacteria group bacterium CG10_big_fil_rev_8_21_14_0_10_46_32]